jgi:cytochrome c551/c552
MQPWATGMRSPAGLGFLDNELFYTDNQGDWMGSGALWNMEKGDFMGHPAGLAWTGRPESPVKLTEAQFNSKIDPRKTKNDKGRYIKPENIVNENFKTLFDMKSEFPELRLPAVWLPYGILGISTSEPITIPKGNFGPFEGQILVGDQGMSMLSRVFMEKVNGEYQGASFVFRTGFRSGVMRMSWARDGSLFIGETNRGWGSAGEANEGLERLVWNNKMPFEMKAVRAMPDGFEIEFTQPVDPKSAEDLASYSVESYIYKYQPVYGSPPVNTQNLNIKGVKLSADGLKARIVVDNLRRYYVHTIKLDGIRERENFYSLVHPTAYYTLNNIPEGSKLAPSELSTKNSALIPEKPQQSTVSTQNVTASNALAAAKPAQSEKVPTFNDVKAMMASYTCLSCHNPDRKLVGPSFKDIAKRKYSPEKILQLIHNPQPENWPEYPTPMPPMPQVKKEDGLKIAAYINSLR